MKDYRDLDVWKVSMALAERVYSLTRMLPKEELYGLSSQIRRSAVSISANIAEGNGRRHRNEYLHFLSIARGSLSELSTLLTLADRIYPGLRFEAELESTVRIGMMLAKLRIALQE